MFPRPSKTEVKELVDRVVKASVRLGKTVPDIAIAYVALNPREAELDAESRARAQDLVERVAQDWRAAEITGATEATVIEDLGADDVVGLLAAMQGSLILKLGSDRSKADEILSIGEATERVQDLEQRPPAGNPPEAADSPELVRRFDDLEMGLLEAVTDAAVFFPRLAPAEGALTEQKRLTCRELLVALASCDRELDRERELLSALVERRDLRASLSLLRSMVQALVLRLSDDPSRRTSAIPLSELAERYVMVREDWKTWE